MVQRVEVSGVGIVEFPDGMSRDEMAAALRQLPTPKTEATPTPAPAAKKEATVRGVDELPLVGREFPSDMRDFGPRPTKNKLGVMDDAPPAPPQKDAFLPIRPEVRQALVNAYDAGSPQERDKLLTIPGAKGDVVREYAQKFEAKQDKRRAEFEKQQRTGVVLPEPFRAEEQFGRSVEARTARLITAGEKPEFAQVAARDAALAGVLPGQEIDYMRYKGLAEPVDVDDATVAEFEKASRVERAAAKAKAGLLESVYGVNQAVAETVGASNFARAQSLSAKDQNKLQNSIGENPDYWKRQTENIINSSAQNAPLIALGVLTGGATLPMTAMFVLKFGQSYAESRRLGLDPATANARATWMGLAEVLGEIPGFGKQLSIVRNSLRTSPLESLKQWVTKTAKKEIAGEQFTLAMETFGDIKGVSPFGVNQAPSVEQYLQMMADTLVQTVGQSALMGGTVSAVGKTAQVARDRFTPPVPAEEAIPTAEQLMREKGFMGGDQRPELKGLQATRKPDLETDTPTPDRTLSALEKARNEGIEVDAPPGPTLSAMERARNEGIEGAPVTPPIEARVQARTTEYERQGYMQDDARLMAERDIAAEARQDVGGRAIQRQDSEDERRTAEGRAERAAMSMEAPSELPEPPSYVTQPSADEYGAAVPSGADRTPRGPKSAFDRGLDTARSITGELDARERTERASLDANQRRIESDISKAFAREATPDLGPILGASWTRSTLARNPTPEEYQDAAYARLEELDGQRPDDAGPAFERAAAPAPAAAKPAEAKAEVKEEAPAGAKMRRPTDREKSNFSASAVIDFGPAGQAVIAEGLQDVYIQDKKGNELSVRQWDSRPGSIKTAAEFPAFVPESLRQPIIDYQDAAYKNKLGTPETQAALNRARTNLQQAVAAQPTTTTEKPSVAQAPKAVEAKEERQAEPAKPAASAVKPVQTTLKDGEAITIEPVSTPSAFSSLVRAEYGEPISLVAKNDAGKEVGRLTYMPNGGPIDVSVGEGERRRGIGSALYDALEEAGGKIPAAESGVAISKEAQALRESRKKKGYKPLAPAEFEPLALEAGRNEALEVEPSEIAEVKKAEQALTKAGTPRKRAPGAGPKVKETSKTQAEKTAQSKALGKFNRDVALLIAKAKEFSERQAMETFETPDEFEYKEALRDMYADQMRAIVYGISQRTGSMAQGYIDAKGYIRSLPAALRERAKALHEGTAKLEDYHEIPPKPEALIERERKSAEYKKARAEGKAKKEALGKPLAATRRTFTDAFNKWFGDSKVVDENGNPLQVYHTGVVDAEEIISGAEVQRRLGKELIFANEGVYFSADPIYSSQYGRNREGVVIYPVYLSIQNPLVITDKKELTRLEKLKRVFLSSKAREDAKVADVTDRMVSMYITEKYKAELIAQGYDGIINEAYNEIVVFEPNQIKSVFNKNPTTDPRILAATRREEQEELGLSESDIYRIEQQLDMRPDPIFKELTSLTGALIYIAESPNQLESELASRLLQDDNIDSIADTSLQVVETDTTDVEPRAKELLDDDAVGAYIPYTLGGGVFLRGSSYGVDQGINSEIVLHEAMHASGAKKIIYVELAEKQNAPVPARLAEAVYQLRDLMDRARETYAKLTAAGTAPSGLGRLAEAGAFTNIQEFYAYGLTDPSMKLFLRDEVPGISTKTTGFDRFVEILMRMFGVDPSLKSGLKDLLLVSNEIMAAKKPSDKALAELARNDLGGPLAAKQNDAENTTTQAKEETKADAEEAKLNTPIFEDQLAAIGLTQKAARTAEGFLNYFVENYYNLTGTAREFWLGQVPTDALLRTMKRAEIKQGEIIKELMRGANTFKLGQMKLVESLGKEWLALKSKEGIRLAEVMHQSTIARVDPSKNKSNGKLNRMWDALTPEARTVYNKVRDYYTTQARLAHAVIIQNVQNSQMNKESKEKLIETLEELYGDASRISPYFPLMRFGRFWLQTGRGDNLRFEMFESEGKRNTARAKYLKGMKRKGDARSEADLRENKELSDGDDINTLRERMADNSDILKDVLRKISELGNTTDATKESLARDVFQMHLMTLPETKFQKAFIHRKDVEGYSKDGLRSFVTAGSRMASQLAAIKYQPKLRLTFSAAVDSIEGKTTRAKDEALIKALENRIRGNIAPPEQNGRAYDTFDNLVHFATKFTFMYHLTDMRALMNNLWALPSRSTPVLTKHFGPLAVLKQMGKFTRHAYAQVGVTKVDKDGNVSYTLPSFGSSALVRNDPLLQYAVEEMDKRGIATQGTQTFDLYLKGIGESASKLGQGFDASVRISGALHQGSERVTREVTFLTAFKMAMSTPRLGTKNKMTKEEAVEFAHDVTDEALYNFLPENMPSWTRNPVARLAIQFHKWAFFTSFYYGSNMREMLKPLPGNTRRGAAYALLGSLSMGAVGSGITGVFGVSFAMGMYQMLANMISDDDDGDEDILKGMDITRWFKEVYLPAEYGNVSIGGYKLSDMMADGVLTTVSGADFTSGLSEGSLYFRTTPDSIDFDSALSNSTVTISAPAVGTLAGIYKAGKAYAEGDTLKAVSKFIPVKTIRAPFDAYRLGKEGAKTPGLESKIDPEEFTKGVLFMQALGFRPATLAKLEDADAFINKHKRQIQTARGDIIRRFVKANQLGRDDIAKKVQGEIQTFNSTFRHSDLTIDDDAIDSYIESVEKRRENTRRGMEVEEKFYQLYPVRERAVDAADRGR